MILHLYSISTNCLSHPFYADLVTIVHSCITLTDCLMLLIFIPLQLFHAPISYLVIFCVLTNNLFPCHNSLSAYLMPISRLFDVLLIPQNLLPPLDYLLFIVLSYDNRFSAQFCANLLIGTTGYLVLTAISQITQCLPKFLKQTSLLLSTLSHLLLVLLRFIIYYSC